MNRITQLMLAAAGIAAAAAGSTFTADAKTPRCLECSRYLVVGRVKPGDPVEYGLQSGRFRNPGEIYMLNPQPLPPRNVGAYASFR